MPGGALAATGAIGGALIGSRATKKAAKTQANAANDAAQMQMQQYQQTRDDMAPWRNVGGGALGMLAQLYDIPYGYQGSGASSAGATGATAGGQDWNAYLSDYPDVMREAQKRVGTGEFQSPEAYAQWHFNSMGKDQGFQVPTRAAPMPGQPDGTPGANDNRFGSFFASPDYQFRLSETMNALNSNKATAGLLKSGGALKAVSKYAGDLASGEFNNYTNRLAALAGVGQTANFQTGSLGADAARLSGNALMTGANANASAALANGRTWGNALSGLGGYASQPNSFAPGNDFGGFMHALTTGGFGSGANLSPMPTYTSGGQQYQPISPAQIDPSTFIPRPSF